MIPKTIHYCWFGGNPLPKSALKCIESWKKYLPNYEIKEWNESNFPIDECPNYAKEAYKLKKWAFVSDYARFKILYENGGLYFDTDVELIKPIDDIIQLGSFMGRGSENEVAPGLGFGAEPGLSLFKEILDYYAINEFDYSKNITVVQIVTNFLKKKGLESVNKIQLIAGIRIYPTDYFSPIDYASGKLVLTENTRSIHHYDASWMEPKDKYAQEKFKLFRRFLPPKLAGLFSEFFSLIKFEGLNQALQELKLWIIRTLRRKS